ncbi:SDR family NAD(P)-dependent oxidoreductase [Natrinema halophilum]|uniref:SDR family oxidoreductase n=1 Tax=Natrinema halophilum TaxID=1699371 RepID=A0A7D5K5M7_9EURY|nr:SDR family NAD(P)-dependent oxidoreductase [Natrinema halophilum]QLG48503.1 SDR family oxidoreductase [Natrinema halophilum]
MTTSPTYPDLDGRIAFVTGANAGIGRTVASTLSDNGVTVIGLDITDESTDDDQFDDLVTDGELVIGDVSDPEDVAAAIDTAESYGRPSIVVNNAGIAGNGRIDEIDADTWRRSFEVHVEGTYNVCRSLLPSMAEANGGSIVNVSSIAGIRGFGSAADYSAAKGAIASLTREMAVDYSPDNVQINAVAPGFIKTEMNASVWRDDEDTGRWNNHDTATTKTLIPRLGEPEDVARLIVFLASDASSFITGQVISVDGGWSSW